MLTRCTCARCGEIIEVTGRKAPNLCSFCQPGHESRKGLSLLKGMKAQELADRAEAQRLMLEAI